MPNERVELLCAQVGGLSAQAAADTSAQDGCLCAQDGCLCAQVGPLSAQARLLCEQTWFKVTENQVRLLNIELFE